MNDMNLQANDEARFHTWQRQKGVLRLYTTTSLNLLADAVSCVAIPLAFLVSTGSVTLAAGLAAGAQIPELLFLLPLGALADRIPRRATIIVSYLVEALCLIALMALLASSWANFWVIFILGIVRGTVSVLAEAASAGYVVQVLGRQHLLQYHARVETVEGAASIAGPSFAGWLVSAVGGVFSLIYSAASSVVNAVVYFFLPPVAVEKSTERLSAQVVVKDTLAGLRLVITDRHQRAMSALTLAVAVTTSSYALAVVFRMRE